MNSKCKKLLESGDRTVAAKGKCDGTRKSRKLFQSGVVIGE